jgi:predicted Zn finger-like uncharacterized protein
MKTQCPNCKARFNTNDASVGKQAKCPKCAKPFTIEPFIETPVVVEPPVKSPEPVAPPAKSPEPVAPPAISAEPTKLASLRGRSGEEKPESKAVSKSASGETSPQSGRTALSKTVFVYCWTGVRIIAGILGALGLMLAIRKEAHSTLIVTFAAANVFLICSVAIEMLLFYRMWAAIQDDKTSISPAKAVGFLFIPVFNIYWALLMVTGFAEDYNAFIQRRAIKTKDLPMALFLIYAFAFILVATVLTTPMICIFAFVGLISRAFIGYPAAAWTLFSLVFAAGTAHFITYILFAFKTCNAINALPERKSR